MIAVHISSLAFRIFDNFDEEPKGIVYSRLGMNKENSGSSRAFARRIVNKLKSAGLHCVKCLLCAFYAKCNMSQPAAPAVSFNQFLHRRIRCQGLDQLNQVGTIADAQHDFAHLIDSPHVLPMHFVEAQHLVGLNLAVQFALLDSDGYMIDELDSGNKL